MSAHIGALERAVGRTLVRRRRGAGIELTAAGLVLLDHAEAILGRLRAAQADMTALDDAHAAPLRVGITQSVGIRALPDIVRRFGRVWPQVRIQPRESETDLDLYGGIEQAELDLTFVELPAPPGPYETLPLLVDPYVLIVRSDSPLAHRPQLPDALEIGDLELIGHTSCRGLRRVEDQIRAAGSEPHFAFRSDVNATVQALVAAGVGVADHAGPGLRPRRRPHRRVRPHPRRAAAHARARLAPRPARDRADAGVHRGGGRGLRRARGALRRRDRRRSRAVREA